VKLVEYVTACLSDKSIPLEINPDLSRVAGQSNYILLLNCQILS